MYSVAAFGNPLLDIVANIENNDLLVKYDIKPDDQKELSDLDMINLYKDISEIPKQISAGGCAQNTLRVMQWLLEKPNSTVFFGMISNDEQGELLRNLVHKDNVATRYLIDENHQTGMCIGLVNQDNRALLANIGAAQYFKKSELENDLESLEILKNVKLIYLEACFLTNRSDAVGFLKEFCLKYNKILAFNLSAVYLFDLVPDHIEYFAKNCHVLFGNHQEYEALAKLMNISGAENIALELNKSFKNYVRTNDLMRYGKILIITNGSNNIKYVHSNGILSEIVVKDISKLPIVDMISAGDSFAAGFLTALLKGFYIEKCIEWGQLAAIQIILQHGCTIPDYPSKSVFKKCVCKK